MIQTLAENGTTTFVETPVHIDMAALKALLAKEPPEPKPVPVKPIEILCDRVIHRPSEGLP